MMVNRTIMIVICIVLSSLHYALIVFNLEESKEMAISKAKQLNDATDSEVLDLFEECKMLMAEQAGFVKIELGINLVYDVFVC